LQRLDYDYYEIIVVNDCSTDSTRAYLDTLQIPNLKVIHNERNEGTCNSRNHGIAVAKYPLIAFTDHDCCPHQDWLTTLEKYFQNNATDFVFGTVEYVAKDYQGYFPERLVRNPNAHWPMGCNFAFRADKIRALGGFDPELFPYGNEDTELALRAITRGMKYERAPDAVVTHQQINWSPQSLLRSAYYASVWPLLKKRYPDHYRHFGGSVKWGLIVNPEDYLYFLTLPILIPVLLARYLYHGKRDLKVFFTKWPAYLFVRRYYIWREAWRQKIVIF
jgi:GT2 family glycosyltransferase